MNAAYIRWFTLPASEGLAGYINTESGLPFPTLPFLSFLHRPYRDHIDGFVHDMGSRIPSNLEIHHLDDGLSKHIRVRCRRCQSGCRLELYVPDAQAGHGFASGPAGTASRIHFR